MFYYFVINILLNSSSMCEIWAECGVSDPKPKCRVITSPAIRGQNVTLWCIMAYRHLTEVVRWSTGASFSASIIWDSAAGTFLRRTSTAITSGGYSVGGILHVEVMTLASGAVIPSYNCTTSFRFTDSVSAGYTFALNDVSWTCVSEPVITSCMYSS